MSIILRPYQQKGIADIRSAMKTSKRIVYVLPTGGGKTITFSYIAEAVSAKEKRVLICVHRENILNQISETLLKFGVTHGRIQSGKTPTRDLVQIGMINTVANRLDKIMRPDLIIFDEGHHAITDSYVSVVEYFIDSFVIAVTATPNRADGRGLNEVFDTLIEGPDARWLMDNNFLAKYDYYAQDPNIDYSQLEVKDGEYTNASIERIMKKTTIVGDSIKHYQKYLFGKSALVFCQSRLKTQEIARNYLDAGIHAEAVDGSMKKKEIDDKLNRFKRGEIKTLMACDLISEGFDVPGVNGVILLRMTKSLPLFWQQIGRALRLKPDGSNAVILDHVGNYRLGLPHSGQKWSLEPTVAQEIEIKSCQKCYKVFTRDEMEDLKNNKPSCHEEDGCLFRPRNNETAPGEKKEIVVIDADLKKLSLDMEWTQGKNIVSAKGAEWRDLIESADSLEKLRQIAKARGYNWQWADRQWASKNGENYRPRYRRAG